MPRFSYRALTPNGHIQHSVIDAETVALAHERLSSHQLIPLHLRRCYLPALFGQTNSISDAALSQWCHQLSTLLEAGIALDEALDELQDEQTTQLPALVNLGYLLREGKSLSEALTSQTHIHGSLHSRWIRLIAAGEKSGHLIQTLHQLAEHLAWQSQEHQRTRQSLLQPLLSAASVMAATLFLVLYLAPQLRPLFNPEHLPLSTRSLFWLTDAVIAHGITLATASTMFLLSLILAYRQHPPLRLKLDSLQLRFPLWGTLLMQQQLAYYIHTWGILYKNGIPLLEAMHDSRLASTNTALQQHLAQAEALITTGYQVHAAFAQTGRTDWPRPTLRLLRHGEKTGQLANALLDLGKQLEQRYQQTTQNIHSLLQPTVTVASGVLLAWVATALLGPLYGQFSHALP